MTVSDCVLREQQRDWALGYSGWHEDAARRMEHGERSFKCPTCRLYFWPDHADEHVLPKRNRERVAAYLAKRASR